MVQQALLKLKSVVRWPLRSSQAHPPSESEFFGHVRLFDSVHMVKLGCKADVRVRGAREKKEGDTKVSKSKLKCKRRGLTFMYAARWRLM